MDLLRAAEFSFRYQHRHEDGSLGTFERVEPDQSHHSPSDHDPEREWATGEVFRCTTCDEEIIVTPNSTPGAPLGPDR
jgi:hypothetical protein